MKKQKFLILSLSILFFLSIFFIGFAWFEPSSSIKEIYIKLNYDLKKDAGIKKFFSFLKNDKQFQVYLIIGIFVVLAMLGVLKYLDIFNKWLTSLVIIPFGMYLNRFKEITSKVSKFVNFYETMKEKTPWIKGKISIKVQDFIKFIEKHETKGGWVNIDLKKSKEKGTLYLELNQFVPKTHEEPEELQF